MAELRRQVAEEERERLLHQREALASLRQRLLEMFTPDDLGSLLETVGEALRTAGIPHHAYSLNTVDHVTEPPIMRVRIRSPEGVWSTWHGNDFPSMGAPRSTSLFRSFENDEDEYEERSMKGFRDFSKRALLGKGQRLRYISRCGVKSETHSRESLGKGSRSHQDSRTAEERVTVCAVFLWKRGLHDQEAEKSGSGRIARA